MRRTADRPMAAGRISLAHGLVLGFAAVFLGTLYLGLRHQPAHRDPDPAYRDRLCGHLHSRLSALPTSTPSSAHFPEHSRRSSAGLRRADLSSGLPSPSLPSCFVWQFPHFMAIGWMYRDEYTAAGVRLTPTLANPREAALSTVIQSLFYRAPHGAGQPLADRVAHHRGLRTP